MSSLTDADAREVMRRFGLAAAPAEPLGNCGGFSGARLWRVRSDRAAFCLKAWPPDMTAERHREIVRLLRHARKTGLAFLPTISDHVEHAERLWDLADWMPGTADFHAQPSPGRLRAVCVALARLHVVWAEFASTPQPCPAVIRRLILARQWLGKAIPNVPGLERAREIVDKHIPDLLRLLEPWRSVPMPAQPCVCDVWHDHILFTSNDVTGLIDFGAIKIDNVAVDLARLLGSLVGDDSAELGSGLDAYAQIRPLSETERTLVRVLDRTGVVLGLANWLRRLFQNGPEYRNRTAVARRMEQLILRAEKWARRSPSG